MSGANDDRRSNRRVKTEVVDQQRMTTLNFEVKLKQPNINARPSYYIN
jgi:hypothetical protein